MYTIKTQLKYMCIRMHNLLCCMLFILSNVDFTKSTFWMLILQNRHVDFVKSTI